jgi:O-antigen/teichoic acid export membrane protein
LATRPRNLGERLKVGAKWSSAEILVSLPVRLGTLAILARLLTPTEFGLFAAAVTVIEFVRPLGMLSMDHALVQSKNLSTESIAFASVLALGLSSLIAATIALTADSVLLLYDDPEVPGLLIALALSGPLAAVSGLLLAVLRRKLAFRELSILTLLSSAIAALASIVAAAAGWGVWALVTGYYFDLALRALFALFLVRPRWVRPRARGETRGLLRFGVGSTLSLMLNFWALHGDYVVIGSVLGPKPLGFYSRAYQLVSTVPGMLGRLHNMVLFPAFSRAQSDKSYLAKALLVGTEATAALTLPLCAWGLVLGPEIIFVLLGPGWEEAVIPFQILSLGVYFRSGYRFAASIVFATGHVFALSACQGIYGVMIVGGALFGARWGIFGVATATLLALLVFYVLLYALTARVSGATAWSFIRVHARPALGFVIVLATAALGRTWFLALDWPPMLILIATVALGILALSGATHVLKNRLWGDFLYQQGLTVVGRRAPATEVENQEHDDLDA